MKKTIFCTTKNENQARQLLEQCQNERFSLHNISLVIPEQKARQLNLNANTKTYPGTSWSAEGNVIEEEETQTRNLREETSYKTENQRGSSRDEETRSPSSQTNRNFENRQEETPSSRKTQERPTNKVSSTSTNSLNDIVKKLANPGTINIPGLGQFFAAGQLKNALTQQSTSAGSLGQFASTLVSHGITENEAKRIETAVTKGDILIALSTSDEEFQSAKEIVRRQTGIENIAFAEAATAGTGTAKKARV